MAAGRLTESDDVVAARAAAIAERTPSAEDARAALELVVRAIDLTTLEPTDTPSKIRSLAEQAVRPDAENAAVPSVAALCVYPALVPTAVEALRQSQVRVASVAGGFPAGQLPLELKLAEVRWAVAHGADEIDFVIDRGAVLAGRHDLVAAELEGAREAAGSARLKMIIETGELGTPDAIRTATRLAAAAGADLVKTSTGKTQPAATLSATLVVAETLRALHAETGRAVGIKPAGGIRTAAQALEYVTLVRETLGDEWLTPERFRLGASSLLAHVVAQLGAQA